MKHSFVLLSIALLSFFAPAASAVEVPAEDKSEVKEHLQNHFKFYGFIRNYFTYDSRESKSGTGNLFYYLPLDQKLNAADDDLNAQSSFRFLALTSRVGVDVSGYYINNVHFGAKIEADFYSGLSGSTGTATLRMRQAYATVTWKELGNEKKNTVGMKIGQAWHPMAADHPHVFSLEVGAPFGPFSRTPQVTMDASFGKNWILTASALWQMQYTSSGPAGSSADYMKYGCTPEIYAGLTYKSNGFLMRAGADMVSLKPRVQGDAVIDGKSTTVKVSDRITTVSAFAYAQYDYKKFSVKAKTTYGSAGEHMNLMSGYVVTDKTLDDGSYSYAPLHSSSSWLSLSYGKKWKGVLFLGYMKNLGLGEGVLDKDLAVSDIYFHKNGSANINQMYRINPEIVYTFGKFVIGLEWQYTAVQYGSYKKVGGADYLNERGLATDNLHWVGNHRVQSMVRFNF